MDAERFDGITRSLSVSRRCALATVLSGSLGLLGLAEVAAKRKKKGKKPNKDKPKCGKAHGAGAGSDAIECPKIRACEETAECLDNFHCVGGQCVEGCDVDVDCATGPCVDNQCTGRCLSDLDCPLGFRCYPGGVCQAVRCYGDEDCPPGQYCLSDFICYDPAHPA